MRGLDPAACVELVRELVCESGEVVFMNGWDGQAPGMSGAIRVVKLSSAYFAAFDDSPIEGPFDSLDDALDHLENPFAITSITDEIECTELSTEELAERIEWWPTDEAGGSLEGFPSSEWPDCEHMFLLNGERWIARCRSGEFAFARADS
ncbi:MAG: hypothetical protein U1F54_05580 [Burkholderiales bacterium]